MIISKVDHGSEKTAPVSTAPAPESSVASTDSVAHLTDQVARGSTWVLMGGFFGRFTQFALHVLLSRVLGASSYGLYAMGRSVMHFMQQFGGLGLPSGVVRFGAAQHGQNDNSGLKGTLIASLLISTIVSSVIAVALFLGAEWISVIVFHEPEFKPVLRVFSLSLPFFILNFVASRVARAFHRMEYDVVIGTVAQPVVNFIIVAVAFGMGFRLGGAVYAFLFATIISAAVGLYFVGRIFPLLTSGLRPTFAVAKLMKYSLTVLGASLSTLLLGETDRIMLGILSTAADVGVYNVAVLVSTQTVFFLTAVNSSFMPMIADLYHRNRHDQLHELFRTTTRWVFIFSVPLLIILLLFPGPVLSIFGSDFTLAVPALMILSVAYFIDAGVGSVGYLLQMSDYHHVLAINNVIMAVLNIVLNFWLIQAYGLVGAAVATGIAISSINFVKLIEVRVLLGMHPYDRRYWKPIVAGLGAVVAGACLEFTVDASWGWVVGAAGTLLAYVGLLILFGPEPQDRFALQTLLRKKGSPLNPTRSFALSDKGQPDEESRDGRT